jgi:hypothetical protein
MKFSSKCCSVKHWVILCASTCSAWGLDPFAKVDWQSRYIFRGQKQAGASIKPAFGLSHNFGSTWVALQGSANLPFKRPFCLKGEVRQMEAVLGTFIDELFFDKDLQLISLSGVYTLYHYPLIHGKNTAHEGNLRLALAYEVSPSFSVAYNPTENQWTFEGGMRYQKPLNEIFEFIFEDDWSISLSALFGYTSIQKPLVGYPQSYTYTGASLAFAYAFENQSQAFFGAEFSLQSESRLPAFNANVFGGIGVNF